MLALEESTPPELYFFSVILLILLYGLRIDPKLRVIINLVVVVVRKINVFSIGIIMQPLHIYVPKIMFQISMNNHASYTSLLN